MNFKTIIKSLTLSLPLLYTPLTCANYAGHPHNQELLNTHNVTSKNVTQQQSKEKPVLDLSDKAIMAALKKDKESKANSFFGKIKMRLDEKCRKEEYHYAVMHLKNEFCKSIGMKKDRLGYDFLAPRYIKLGLMAAIAESGRSTVRAFVHFDNLEYLYVSNGLHKEFGNNPKIITSNILRKWMTENPKKIIIA